jgi:hypothetical protein
MAQPDDRNSPHWSADFVEHIRTVHFALVGVCLALIGVIQFKKPLEVTTAQSQLQEIKSAVDRWDTDVILQNALSNLGLNSFPPMFMPVAGKIDNAFRVDNRMCVMSEATAILLPANNTSAGHIIYQDKWKEELFKKPSSLREFRDFWDRKATALSFKNTNHAGDKILLARKNGADEVLVFHPGKIDFSSGSFEGPEISMTDRKQEQSIADLLHVSPARFVLSWNLGEDKALLPVPISETTLDVQPALIRTHPYWKPGAFSRSFSDLDKATASVQDRSFEGISSNLQEEASKPKTESFEVFGVKFPVEKATRWGILLIVGIQLYLWIHLHELSPKLKEGDAGWDVAWIGVYRSLPARTLFVSSTALLPVLTIGALGNNALRGATPLVWAVYITALLASLVLAYLIARSVPRHDLPHSGPGTPRVFDTHDHRK